MVFTDLKKILDKENRLFLILVLLLVIGFTFAQFGLFGLGTYIFVFLLGICIVLIIATLIFQIDLKHLSHKQIILYLIIAIAITFLLIMRFYLGYLFFQGFFIFGIVLYVTITATFLMYSCYHLGVAWDDKIYNKGWMWLRWVVFLGGTLIAIFFMLSITRLGIALQHQDLEIQFAFGIFALILTIIVIFFAVIGGLLVLRRKLNAWLGFFFIWVAIYTLYLMLMVYFTLSSSESQYRLPIIIALYLFDLFLILYTIGKLIGERADIISKKVKFLKADAILILLIFSKAAYEFGATEITAIDASRIGAIWSFLLFIPLLFITGLYGIITYSKVNKEREQNKETV
ncbi:MAG: hypothetical protein ACFFDK_05290 [Promethearchaeota archaeon]